MGCLGVPRWHETGGNKEKQGEKVKEIEKEEEEISRKTATILWLSLGAIFSSKTGHFLRFLPFQAPPSEVTAIKLSPGRKPKTTVEL